MKVMKFGGSSLSDAAQWKKVRDIVLSDAEQTCIVVSAPGKRSGDDHKITDLLYLCHAHLEYGVDCGDIFRLIVSRYTEIRDALKLQVDPEAHFSALWEKMQRGISRDELVSRGEYFSALLLAAYLGFDFIDAKDWLLFSEPGRIDTERSYKALKELAEGRKIVTPGFYGAMPDGKIAVLTRGGSDITGALAAAALDAEVYENMTDVSGILMADPRIVPEAKPIRHITYSELRELSYLGAQVLHEGAVFPVREKNIPLHIRSTNAPNEPGTLICERFDDEKPDTDDFITGVAGKKGFSILTVQKSGLSSRTGAMRKVLEIFEKFGVFVYYTPSGIDCCSVVVQSAEFAEKRYAVEAELQKELRPDDVRVIENIAILAAVGRKMVFRTGTSGKLFAKLGEHGINIRMISQGPEELNIIVGVKEDDFERAVRVLYESFVSREETV